MAHGHRNPDDRGREPDEDRGCEARLHGASSSPSTVVATTDPVVVSEAEQRAEWTRHPSATVVTEPIGVQEPAPVFLSGVRPVVLKERPRESRARDAVRNDDRDDDHSRGRKKNGARAEQDDDRDRDDDRDQDDDRSKGRKKNGARGEKGSSKAKIDSAIMTATMTTTGGTIGRMMRIGSNFSRRA